jgi:hypothetical protein
LREIQIEVEQLPRPFFETRYGGFLDWWLYHDLTERSKVKRSERMKYGHGTFKVDVSSLIYIIAAPKAHLFAVSRILNSDFYSDNLQVETFFSDPESGSF